MSGAPGADSFAPANAGGPVSQPSRVLVMAEAVTLAHLGRGIAVAGILHRAGFRVVLACDRRHERFLDGLPFAVTGLASIPPAAFLEALAHGRAVLDERTLRHAIEDDVALLGDTRPDAVVGDFRLSLSVSARLAKVPYANVTNAYWSRFASSRYRLPALPGSRAVPARIGDAAFRLVRPFAFAVHARPMNRVRRAYGLAPLRADIRDVYCDGDCTLYADVPELVPTVGAPPTHRYIGPLQWAPPVEPPPWWDAVMTGPAPIYVSMGSSGLAHGVRGIVDALASLGRDIVVATAGRASDVVGGAHVHVAEFVPGDLVAAKACAVVCNGGSPTSLQALVHGVPVVGIAANLDQFLNMSHVERFGAGVLLRADRVRPRDVRAATRRLLDDPRYRARAAVVRDCAARTTPERALPEAIRAMIGAGRAITASPHGGRSTGAPSSPARDA